MLTIKNRKFGHLRGFFWGGALSYQGEGVFLGNPKDSVWEDWGTLGNIREDYGNHDPPKQNPMKHPQSLHPRVETLEK